jgi:deazaflavin-dependent oxidoreductase (nitroreductase family)
MKAPRALARFNKRVTNPIQSTYAPHLRPWAVVTHVGRRSGRTYRTPVLAFRSGTTLAVVLFYGTEADWIRNVLAAGHATITRGGTDYHWTGLHIVSPKSPEVSGAARLLGRSAGAVLVGNLSW